MLSRRALVLCAVMALSACLLADAHSAPVHPDSDGSSSSSLLASDHLAFASFQSRFDRTYASAAERQARFGYFRANLRRAEALNRRHRTNVFGLTKFADVDHAAEFRPQYLAYRPNHQAQQRAVDDANVDKETAPVDVAALPSAWDWRDAGIVTQVNNQGQCGACWAFSAVETIESAFLQTNSSYLPEVSNGWGLSVQEAVDCSNAGLFGGCQGGWADLCYERVKKSGIMNATSDPWISGGGQTGICLPLAAPVTYVSNYTFATPPCLTNCDQQRMDLLQQTVALKAPVSVCLDADAWDSYTGGIFPASACSSAFTSMDHCVQLVGYSVNQTDPTQSYWIVRNSWNSDWGLAGYIHLELNFSANTCGIGNQATNVVISTGPATSDEEEERIRFE